MSSRNNYPAKRQRPIIRIYVSSNFSDLKLERDALAQRVFPKLEQRCLREGFQFQAIDMRWGVSTQAALDHRAMRICFDELRRSQEVSPAPNFMTLLGNRYGWRPLPEEISDEEFQRLEDAAHQINVAHLQPVDVVRQWYRCDANALPPVYILQPRSQLSHDGRDYTEIEAWQGVEQVLWAIINRAFPTHEMMDRFSLGLSTIGTMPQIVRLQASATEQEIWRGALTVSDADQHVLAFFREITNREEFAPSEVRDYFDFADAESVDVNAQLWQDSLKQELRSRLGANAVDLPAAHLIPAKDANGQASISTEHIDALCEQVELRLAAIIDHQISEYWHAPLAATDKHDARPGDFRIAREFAIERDEHLRFAEERAVNFVGRDGPLARIQDYLNNDSRLPLVIHGDSGCGKTALLARAFQEIPPKTQPIIRFIGATLRSLDLGSLLRSLCDELRGRRPLTESLASDVSEAVQEFHHHLAAATAEQPVILLLDALDQLADKDSALQLHWLPASGSIPLPQNVKIIVSCLSDGSAIGQPYAALQRRGLPAENMVNVNALSLHEAKTVLFDHWLSPAQRTLSEPQRRLIEVRLESSAACRQPLYLKLLLNDVTLWHSYDVPPNNLPDNVTGLLERLADRLSLAGNHGPILVARAFGYIAASRRGLSETEILEVLFADRDFRRLLDETSHRNNHTLPTEPPRIPFAVWSRLRADLSPYLIERSTPSGKTLTMYHREIAEWMQTRFVRESAWSPYYHSQLAQYKRLRLVEQGYSIPPLPMTQRGDVPKDFPDERYLAAILTILLHACEGNEHAMWLNVMTDFAFLRDVVERVEVTVGLDANDHQIPWHDGYYVVLDEIHRWLEKNPPLAEATELIQPLLQVWNSHKSEFVLSSDAVMQTLYCDLKAMDSKEEFDRATKRIVVKDKGALSVWCEKERQKHETPNFPWEGPPEPTMSGGDFIFISYKREDLPRITSFMRRIKSWGFEIWYDRGIPGGAEWDALIEEKVSKCKVLLVFLSQAAVDSKWVRREIKFADSENRPILGIRLDKDIELKHGLKVVMNQYQMIDATDVDFSDELRKAIEYVRLL